MIVDEKDMPAGVAVNFKAAKPYVDVGFGFAKAEFSNEAMSFTAVALAGYAVTQAAKIILASGCADEWGDDVQTITASLAEAIAEEATTALPVEEDV